MKNININKVTEGVIRAAAYEVETYSSKAKEISPIPLSEVKLTPRQLKHSTTFLQTIRRSDRFLALAHSTVISLLNLDGIEKEPAGEFWVLHATLALNLNVADVGFVAASKAIENLGGIESLNLARAYSLLATSSRNLGDYPSAIASYSQARRIAVEIGDVELATWQVFRLGKMYVNYLQQPSRGVEYLTNSNAAFQELNRPSAMRGSAACLDQLGDVFRQTTINLNRAEQLYRDALALNEKISNKRGIARNLAHLGMCAEKKRDFISARTYLEEAVMLTRETIGEERGTAIRLGQLARICMEIKDADSIKYAEQYLAEASELCRRFREFKYMARHEISWGILYRRQKDYSKAKARLDLAVELGKKYRLYEVEADAYDQLAELFSVDFQDYMQAQNAVIASAQVRMRAWNHISESNPDLEEVENKIEIAFMYKSLFEKLLNDSESDFNKSIQTIRHAYEIALRESQAKYENISRLLQVGALMSGIKHESLNLLNDIVSSISQILKDTSVDERVRERLHAISERSLMGLETFRGPVIQKLLSAGFSSQETIMTRAVLPPIFEWIKRGNAHYGITTVLGGEIPDVYVECDPTVLRLMLGSMIQNARESFHESPEKKIRISVLHKVTENKLCIDITDSGAGMDINELKKAYQVGYTTKSNHTGLGLPTVSFLLESIGGRLEVNSIKGLGTTVRLYLSVK